MPPAKALAALRARPDLALLIDRRALSPEDIAAAELIIEAVVDLPESVAKAYLFRRLDSNPLPTSLGVSDRANFTRLMDRFFVPTSTDTAVVSAFFDLIADLYDEQIRYTTNLKVARHLLGLVLATAPASPRILDFGCGTGVANEALRSLDTSADMVGTDISTAMLRHAVERGQMVLTIDRWRAEPSIYDGAIACFVLHYGVPDLDLVRIAGRLARGGRFAANFFKARDNDIQHLTNLMADEGLTLVPHTAALAAAGSENPVLVFERSKC